MDSRAIGVLDTGVGGLTAVRRLRALLPGEDIVFFADTARVPYGGRTLGQIRRMSLECVEKLTRRGIKALLVACGTITAACLDDVASASGVPACGVIAPAAAEAVAASASGRIGALSTLATARTGAFKDAVLALRPDAAVTLYGCGELVPLVEAGRTSPEDAEVADAVFRATAPFREQGADTLILGCTHFPLLYEAMSAALPGVTLIDSGAAGARECCRMLKENSLLSDRKAGGKLTCAVSGDRDSFRANATIFMPGVEFEVEKA